MKKFLRTRLLLALHVALFFFGFAQAKEVSGGPINVTPTCATVNEFFDVDTTPALNTFTLSSIRTTFAQSRPNFTVTILQALITCEGGGSEGYGVCSSLNSTLFSCPASDRAAPVVNLIQLADTTTLGTYCQEVVGAANSVSTIVITYTQCN